jgi:hypothetical protein
MRFLEFQAYMRLIQFDLFLARGDFSALYEAVRRCRIQPRAASQGTVERVCMAIDLACIWYWKEALCLQRSAATACLLRRYGVAAEMVLGAQRLPFKAHAWVEVGGSVVNDKPYVREIYGVLDRC